MKRDPRLQGLSSDHHQALVLARRVRRRTAAGTLDGPLVTEVARRFRTELEPHFQVEEEVLLPALLEIGEANLVTRTLDDHAFLRAQVSAAENGALDALAGFGQRLHEHVRFEERSLFPACEEKLSDPVLEEAARRAPKD
jgi:hemerythrin-like domain-containing protein